MHMYFQELNKEGTIISLVIDDATNNEVVSIPWSEEWVKGMEAITVNEIPYYYRKNIHHTLSPKQTDAMNQVKDCMEKLKTAFREYCEKKIKSETDSDATDTSDEN